MKRLLLICVLFLTTSSFAAEELYPFKQAAQSQRFYQLSGQLRCLVCQNQNLNESNSGLANDLRGQIYQQILNGQSDQQIINYMVTRYGDFILYQPPLKLATLGLWFGPGFILISALIYLFYYLRKQRGNAL